MGEDEERCMPEVEIVLFCEDNLECPFYSHSLCSSVCLGWKRKYAKALPILTLTQVLARRWPFLCTLFVRSLCHRMLMVWTALSVPSREVNISSMLNCLPVPTELIGSLWLVLRWYCLCRESTQLTRRIEKKLWCNYRNQINAWSMTLDSPDRADELRCRAGVLYSTPFQRSLGLVGIGFLEKRVMLCCQMTSTRIIISWFWP